MTRKAQLFITCLGDQFYTRTLQNMIDLLERLGVELVFPAEQTCCGQPLFNNGFEDKTRPVALNFMRAFSKSDAPLIGPSGSCVSMVKHHYPSLFKEGTSEHTLAVDISSRIFEFSEYLVNVLKVTDVGAAYPHKVTYHASCHLLREMGLKTEAKSLLSSVKGLELVVLNEEETCCGFGGAFTVTYPEVSRSMMDNKVHNIIASGADTVVMCEPGCLMNIAGGLHKAGSSIRAMHIIDVLAQTESNVFATLAHAPSAGERPRGA
jgi:L-lactate dehydrogenase complex protein LldE